MTHRHGSRSLLVGSVVGLLGMWLGFMALPLARASGWEAMPGLVLPYSRLFIVVLSMLSVVAVYWLLYRSTAGLKVRAVMQNRDIACCMGIAARRIDAFTLTCAANTWRWRSWP